MLPYPLPKREHWKNHHYKVRSFNLSILKGGYQNKQIFHNETLLDYITNLPTQGDGLCSSSYLRNTHE